MVWFFVQTQEEEQGICVSIGPELNDAIYGDNQTPTQVVEKLKNGWDIPVTYLDIGVWPRWDFPNWQLTDDESFDYICKNGISNLHEIKNVVVRGVGEHPMLLTRTRLQCLFACLPASLEKLVISGLSKDIPGGFQMITKARFPQLTELTVSGCDEYYDDRELFKREPSSYGLTTAGAEAIKLLCHSFDTLTEVKIRELLFQDEEDARKGFEQCVQAVCGSETMAGLLHQSVGSVGVIQNSRKKSDFVFNQYSETTWRDNRDYFYPSLNAAYPQHRNMGNRVCNVTADDIGQLLVDLRNYAERHRNLEFPWAAYYHVMRQLLPTFLGQWSERTQKKSVRKEKCIKGKGHKKTGVVNIGE